ncbi:hypothetical protein BDF21DRAFT_20506 [Thamnidium elegans]|uniref:J domain-containing protein n=1 Tax=Thamnidium elegans TaxID=101142 RepID=A0A8H7SYY7_9FUNG|nr:hypothetical protein INT48_001813 [Thamnidium elegans]KAI8096067.1 hypothetical protein BDF21DRAFT_20506 [Thamnidium elegans]
MISQCLLGHEEIGEKYTLVNDILSASNYYEALGLSDDSNGDEIRRAYIKKSRICHPDKFVPPYSKATQSFQLLSTAYITLIQPSSKLQYDMCYKSNISHCSSTDNAVDVFEQVIRQLYIEIMEGEFQTLRTVIHAMNETNKLIHVNDDVLAIAEVGFLKIRDIILSSQKYYRIIQFELLRLYELQEEIRSVSYFDVWRRIKLSIAIAKVVVQIPLTVNSAIKQEEKYQGGLLGLQIEYGLQKAVTMFESSASEWV